MNIFEILVVQPIFNVLAFIYGIIPGADFGIAIIVFTIIIRLILWPLVKKQLHQTKVMRKLQPKLKLIKKKAKGNKALESQMMLELYREHGVSPFSSIGVLLLQLPILISLYLVIQLIIKDKENISRYTYEFIERLPRLQDVVQNHENFRESLFGVVNLTEHAFAGGRIYWPIIIMAAAAAVLQYIQSKQIAPKVAEKRRLRDMLKEQAAGKDIDQSEVSAQMAQNMILIFPVLTFVVCMYLPGALVLYYMVSSLVAVWQQKIILSRDEVELEELAARVSERKAKKAGKNNSSELNVRVRKATEAEVVAEAEPKQPRGTKSKKSKSKRAKGKKRG